MWFKLKLQASRLADKRDNEREAQERKEEEREEGCQHAGPRIQSQSLDARSLQHRFVLNDAHRLPRSEHFLVPDFHGPPSPWT
jgi:hypothetical protein